MQFYEIETLMENMWMKDKTSWDLARLIINWCQQSTKPVNMFEKMKFPWDEKVEKIEDTPEEIENMRKEMKAMEDRLNKK
jgi:hypothetical protein